MATFQHNISGNIVVALLSPGDRVSSMTAISIANTHASDDVLVDLYIGSISSGGTAAVSYYILKGHLIYKGDTLISNSENLKFANGFSSIGSTDDLGLFVKLNASDSSTDIIISK